MQFSREMYTIAAGGNRFGAQLVSVRGAIGPYRTALVAYNELEGSLVLVAGDNFVAILQVPPGRLAALLEHLLQVVENAGHSLAAALPTRRGLLGKELPTVDELAELVEEHLPN